MTRLSIKLAAYGLVGAVTVFSALVAGETFLRVKTKQFEWKNHLAHRHSYANAGGYHEYHARLGWVPKPAPPRHYHGMTVTVHPHGVRSNGNWSLELVRPDVPFDILAVGDSFTFGDEVHDWQTWPAQLERISGQRVINAGVCAYGADQVYLRAAQMTRMFRPRVLLFSIILNDVERMVHSVRHGAGKPFFAFDEGRLALRNVPVPRDSGMKHLRPVQKVLAYSLFLHTLAMKFFPEAWGGNVAAKKDGWYRTFVDSRSMDQVFPTFCALMQSLKSNLDRRNIKPVLVALPVSWQFKKNSLEDPVINCAAQANIPTINVIRDFRHLYEASPVAFKSSFSRFGHLSEAGNRRVAELIAQSLREAKL